MSLALLGSRNRTTIGADAVELGKAGGALLQRTHCAAAAAAAARAFADLAPQNSATASRSARRTPASRPSDHTGPCPCLLPLPPLPRAAYIQLKHGPGAGPARAALPRPRPHHRRPTRARHQQWPRQVWRGLVQWVRDCERWHGDGATSAAVLISAHCSGSRAG
jgi:hypothetical protein